MKKIKAYTGYNDYTGTHYFKEFEVISHSEIEDIAEEWGVSKVYLDAEQGRDEVADYEYYSYDYKDEDGDTCRRYVAIEKLWFETELSKLNEEDAQYLNDRFNLDFSDMLLALDGAALNNCYFSSKEWESVCDSLSDQELDNFYTDFGRKPCEYDRTLAVENLEDMVQLRANKNYKKANEVIDEYYQFEN